MADQAKTRPAATGKAYQLLPIIGPSAGVDLRSSPTLVAADRARTLLNCSLAEPGALVVRAGYTAFSSNLSTALGRLQGGARVYLNTAIPSANSTTFTLVGVNGNVYSLTDSGGWSASLLSSLSTSNDLDFVHDRDLVAVFDGLSTSIRKSTNGSSWTRFGIAAGTGLSSISTSASTGPFIATNEYEFSYTYKDRDLVVESNESPASTYTLLAGSNHALAVQVPNSADGQVDAIVVYARNKTSGETIRRRASSGVKSAAASSTLVITSTTWITNDEAPTDHNLAPVLSFGVVWKNRWWARSATVTNRIHFTQLFQPQSWPSLFYIDIPFEQGDAIQALFPLGDTLMIFGTTKIYVIIGQTSLDFEVKPTLASQDGALGFRAVAACENGIIHAGATGVYIFEGTTDRLLSYDIEPAWRDLVANASPGDLTKIAMVYHQKEKELRIAVPRVYPTGTWGEWILDLNRTRTTQTPAWATTDRTIGGYMLWSGPEATAGNRQRLFSWHSSIAQVFEDATGHTANSSNFIAEYEGPGLTLGAMRARWVDVRGEYEPHAGAFSFEPYVDGLSQGVQGINIGAGLTVYGTGVYGTSVYAGSGRRQFYRTLPLSADGRTFVMKMRYEGQEQLKIFSYHPGLVNESRSRSFDE